MGVANRSEYALISTHALTWSATGIAASGAARSQFQLTRSRGARPLYKVLSYESKSNFNSRAHVERDLTDLSADTQGIVFQLTRSRGARPDCLESQAIVMKISTHALTWSATLCDIRKSQRGEFQLTRSRGARQLVDTITADFFSFQLTRSRGARPVPQV